MGRLYSSNTLEVFQDFYPKPNQSSVDLKFLSPPAKEMRESKVVLKNAWKIVNKPGNLWKRLVSGTNSMADAWHMLQPQRGPCMSMPILYMVLP